MARKLFIVLMLLGFFSVLAQNQSKNELEQKRSKLLDEINFTKKRLTDVRKRKKSSLNEIVILKRQVKTRESLIKNINQEIELISNQIEKNKRIVLALERDLEKLKIEYAEMVKVAYKNRSNYKNMLFIMSSRDFMQAFQRLKYIQQYNEFRQDQAELIQKTQSDIEKRIAISQKKLTEKELLIQAEENQRNIYLKESQEQNHIYRVLQRNEKELKKELRKKEQARRKLNLQIQAIIRKTPAGSGTLNSAESVEISSGFAKNKGRLPWPVSKGLITEHFGENQHPVLKNVKTFNNGIDIAVAENEPISAIFDGEVTGIVSIPGMQKTVIVRHGDYLSVYAHLETVKVKMGDKISVSQELGTVYTDSKNGKTQVHFEVWKGTTKLNPEPWLRK